MRNGFGIELSTMRHVRPDWDDGGDVTAYSDPHRCRQTSYTIRGCELIFLFGWPFAIRAPRRNDTVGARCTNGATG